MILSYSIPDTKPAAPSPDRDQLVRYFELLVAGADSTVRTQRREFRRRVAQHLAFLKKELQGNDEQRRWPVFAWFLVQDHHDLLKAAGTWSGDWLDLLQRSVVAASGGMLEIDQDKRLRVNAERLRRYRRLLNSRILDLRRRLAPRRLIAKACGDRPAPVAVVGFFGASKVDAKNLP